MVEIILAYTSFKSLLITSTMCKTSNHELLNTSAIKYEIVKIKGCCYFQYQIFCPEIVLLSRFLSHNYKPSSFTSSHFIFLRCKHIRCISWCRIWLTPCINSRIALYGEIVHIKSRITYEQVLIYSVIEAQKKANFNLPGASTISGRLVWVFVNYDQNTLHLKSRLGKRNS